MKITYRVDVVGKFSQRFTDWMDAYEIARANKHPGNQVLLWSSTGDLWEVEMNGYRRVGF